jgi:hypothetical protein
MVVQEEEGDMTAPRPLDYSAGGHASLERFFRSVPLLSLSRPHPTVLTLHVRDSLPQALAVPTLLPTSCRLSSPASTVCAPTRHWPTTASSPLPW